MGLAQIILGTVPAVLGGGWLLLRRRLGRRDGGGGSSSVVVVRRGGSLSTRELGPDAISFLSYNILADVYAFRHSSYCPPEHLEWTARWQRITETLAAAAADVVCLQEVDSSNLEEVQAWAAEQGYALSAQEGKKPARCVTLWRADRLQLFWADTKRSRALCTALLYLDSSGTTQVVYVANCHLEGAPEKVAERLVQARNVLGSMARHQEAEGLVPVSSCSVVVTGDFNEGPNGSVAHLLHHGWAQMPAGASGGSGNVSGGASAASLAAAAAMDASGEASQPYLFRDAYAAKPLPYTRRVPRLGSMLDQLWASSHARVTHLLHAQHPSDAAGMPNASAPSDHLPLGAIVVFPAAVPLAEV